MKGLLFVIACLAISCSADYVEAQTEYDFRRINWGMGPEEVKATEAKPPDKIDDEGDMAYLTSVVGKRAVLWYMFFPSGSQSKLWKAQYILMDEYRNDNNYIRDFSELFEKLKLKYGSASSDPGWQWNQTLYQDDPERHGFAVSLGHVARWVDFKTDKTTIRLAIWGENYKINVLITYTSNEYKDAAESAAAASEASDL